MNAEQIADELNDLRAMESRSREGQASLSVVTEFVLSVLGPDEKYPTQPVVVDPEVGQTAKPSST
jgi:hypothetical protein